MDFAGTAPKNRTIEPCLGVPVRFDENASSASISLDFSRWWWPWRITLHPCFCEQRGLWRWREIVVGRAFFAFPPREQQAILLHEVGHVKLEHIGKRIRAAWRILFAPRSFAELCVAQEYEADRFAADCGYGADLARFFIRINAPAKETLSSFHPPHAERIRRLQAQA